MILIVFVTAWLLRGGGVPRQYLRSVKAGAASEIPCTVCASGAPRHSSARRRVFCKFYTRSVLTKPLSRSSPQGAASGTALPKRIADPPQLLATCDKASEARGSATGVFLTTQTEYVPITLQQNLKHNKVLHRTVLLVRVVTQNIPRVAGADRIKARELGSGFWHIEAHFGFAQTPNVLRELGRANVPELELDPNQLSFFVGRANVKSSSRPGMARWRERLYSALIRVAARPTEFFRIPPDRVIELGAEVEI